LAAWVLVSLRRLPPGRIREAVYRNVSRPLTVRMDAHLEVPVSGGSRMVVDTSEALGRTLAISGVWEPNVTPVFRSLLGPGDVCVDVGAGIGYYTLLASGLVDPGGHVYALEPAPRPYAALCSNLELNGVSNVTALRVAAGREDGRALLYDPPPGNLGQSSMRVTPDARIPPPGIRPATEVPVHPIGSLLRESDIDRVRLVKIDVEGSEVDVLRGLEPLLDAGCRPSLLVELHPWLWVDEDAEAFTSFCRRFGLRSFQLIDEHRSGHALSDPIRVPFEPDALDELEDVVRALLVFGESAEGSS
jgi:FkbM family methyltransferase